MWQIAGRNPFRKSLALPYRSNRDHPLHPLNEHKRAKRWTALLFPSSKPKPSELQLRKGALLRRTPRPCLAQAPLPLPISLASRISATAPFFRSPRAPLGRRFWRFR